LTTLQLQSLLRADAAGAAIGLVLAVVGAGAIVLFRLLRLSKNRELLWLGAFSLLYGARLLAKAAAFQLLFDLPDTFWPYLISALTYVMPLFGILFVREIIPENRKRVTAIAWFQGAFAITGMLADQILGKPRSLFLANNLIVIAFALLLGTRVFRRGRTSEMSRFLLWATVLLFLTVMFANVATLRSSVPFDPEPLGFLVFMIALGHLVAVRMISNQERLLAMDKELEIARRIQASILPQQTPSGAGLRIEAHYLPMTAVAGDFYDFLRVDDHRFGILIADVSGHGVPAALIASMVKIAIAAQIEHADQPARVLAGINQVLCGKMQGQFVTAAYVFLDLETRSMRYAAAGHPAMLWWRADRQAVEQVEENGIVLGIFAHAPYKSIDLKFGGGDRLLLYTDGLPEAGNEAQEFFGIERAAACLNEPDCTKTILKQLADWAGYNRGRQQDDDLTMVLVELS
jgi:sigma-B regulation protein RsbU (phosphoserine phosphatase)